MNKKTAIVLVALTALVWLGFVGGRYLQTQFMLSGRNIPNTPEAKEIMRTVEKAYEIEIEAAHTFDLSKFSTVFINDPRFDVSSGTLETIRELTNNPSLESAGWLDYKMAYHSWRIGSTLHAESVQAKAKEENRDLTVDEKKSLVDSHGRIAPVRAQGSIRKLALKFLSVDVNGDIALVVVNDGPTTVELTMVLVDGKWYIAGFRGISVHP